MVKYLKNKIKYTKNRMECPRKKSYKTCKLSTSSSLKMEYKSLSNFIKIDVDNTHPGERINRCGTEATKNANRIGVYLLSRF